MLFVLLLFCEPQTLLLLLLLTEQLSNAVVGDAVVDDELDEDEAVTVAWWEGVVPFCRLIVCLVMPPAFRVFVIIEPFFNVACVSSCRLFKLDDIVDEVPRPLSRIVLLFVVVVLLYAADFVRFLN